MRRATLLFGIFLAAIIASFGCQKIQSPSTTSEMKGTEQVTEAEASQPAATSMATIVVGSTPFSVEIAETDQQKEKGLMGRESMPETSGMWFVFDRPVTEKFWMKDTVIPLDIIFVDQNMQVVYIAANAVPGSTDLISSPAPYQYVLEVNAGAAARHSIKIGDTAEKRVGTK